MYPRCLRPLLMTALLLGWLLLPVSEAAAFQAARPDRDLGFAAKETDAGSFAQKLLELLGWVGLQSVVGNLGPRIDVGGVTGDPTVPTDTSSLTGSTGDGGSTTVTSDPLP